MKLRKLCLLMVIGSMVTMSIFSNGNEEDTTVFNSNDGPLEKYTEQISVTAFLEERVLEDSDIPKGITPDTQSWINIVKDNLNINLDFEWSVPSNQYKEKLSLSIVSGDVADILYLDSADFENLRQSDMLADLSESYKRFASVDLKDAIESDNGLALSASTYDGKLMAIPNYMDPYQQVQLIWLREDWRLKLGLPVPNTMDDLLHIMRAFTDEDPDNNGIKDTYGLGLNKELIFWGFDIRGFLNSFGAYSESWIKDENGKLVYGDIQDEVLDALKVLRELYAEGVIDPEYAVKDYTKVSEDVVAGKIGLIFGEWWYPNWPLNSSKDKDPNAEWKCYELVSSTSNPVNYGIKRNWISNYNAVSKNAKHPEAAIKMLNLFYDIYQFGETRAKEQYGDSAVPEGGFVYNWVPQRVYYPLTFNRNYKAIQSLLDSGEVYEPNSAIIPDVWDATKAYLSGDKSSSNWGLYYSRAAKDGGWGLTEKVRESGNIEYDEFYGSRTPTQIERGDTLKRLRDESFHKIIMGFEPLDSFDEYVSSWKKLGGDEITKEVNAWYKSK